MSRAMRPAAIPLGTALTALLVAALPARADLQQVALSGEVAVAGATRAARLRVLCEPDAKGGAITFELWIPEAATRKDFDYDDFEGPDAPAADRMLSRLGVGGGGAMMMGAKSGGWYAGEEPDTFVFGISQPAHEVGAVSTLLEAVDPRDTTLTWVQTSLKDPGRELRATFTLDPEKVKQIHHAVDACLPAAKLHPPAKT